MRRACVVCGGIARKDEETCGRARCVGARAERTAAKAEKHRLSGVGGRPWRRFRARVLERDGGLCRLELDDRCLGRAQTVHIDPAFAADHRALLALGEEAALEHALSACRACHGRADGGRSRGGRGKLRAVEDVPPI